MGFAKRNVLSILISFWILVYPLKELKHLLRGKQKGNWFEIFSFIEYCFSYILKYLFFIIDATWPKFTNMSDCNHWP